MGEYIKSSEEGSRPEAFFNIDQIESVYSFKPMVDNWRAVITADSNHWWDISRQQMVRDLPESERQGIVENSIVHINKYPWHKVPRSIQEVLVSVYDCASYDPDDKKQVSLIVGDSGINLKLISPSLREGIYTDDLYGENKVTAVSLQLVDFEHPPRSGYGEPSRIPSGFWEFAKWPIARDAREREIGRRRYEEGIEPTFEERLMFYAPKTKIAMANIGELKDLAGLLEKSTSQAIVWYIDHRFLPKIANAPWTDIVVSHNMLTIDEEGNLEIKPLDENQN